MAETTPTKRLYYDDPHLTEFRARVVGHGTWQGRTSLVVDQTLFYPEAGGQNADRGKVAGVRIADAQVDDAGVIHHLPRDPEAVLPAAGAEIDGEIDAKRRRDNMAQHTGQHMLSGALLTVAGARTVSSRLGETASTIDVHIPGLTPAKIREAQDLVNAMVEANLEVRAYFPEPDELARLPLRRKIKVDSDVRVVAIGDFDMVPCGGTHCTRTGQVGLVHVTASERYKGMTRITFVAGARAHALLSEHFETLSGLGRDFTCGALEVPNAVDKLRRELADARETARGLRNRLADATAAALLAQSRTPLVSAAFEGLDAAFLRALGQRITVQPDKVALLAVGTDANTLLFVARGAESTFDCGAFVQAVARATGGKGGGRPQHAEGRLPPRVDWSALVAEHAPAAT